MEFLNAMIRSREMGAVCMCSCERRFDPCIGAGEGKARHLNWVFDKNEI
jgi:hypothetical protein